MSLLTAFSITPNFISSCLLILPSLRCIVMYSKELNI
jgi:hypothetical protein